ncbi:hypothetical protein C2S51_033187 [Perilla frutescens var. frutescens]|nr:hypothetical protein C2S51_033187 [Perilla frutescens var. frutescens]
MSLLPSPPHLQNSTSIATAHLQRIPPPPLATTTVIQPSLITSLFVVPSFHSEQVTKMEGECHFRQRRGVGEGRAFPAMMWGYIEKGPILEKHRPTPSSSAVFCGGVLLGKGERVQGRRLTTTELLHAGACAPRLRVRPCSLSLCA